MPKETFEQMIARVTAKRSTAAKPTLTATPKLAAPPPPPPKVKP